MVESLKSEVVVGDQACTDAAFGIDPMGLNDALRGLDAQASEIDHGLLGRVGGLHDGVYTVRVTAYPRCVDDALGC